jgi:hypothetical protein
MKNSAIRGLLLVAACLSVQPLPAQTLCDHPMTAPIAKKLAWIDKVRHNVEWAGQRRFNYTIQDLNADGKPEYVVVMLDSGGTGGRVVYLFSHRLEVVTRWTVMKFPIYASTHIRHHGWADLYTRNMGKLRVAHFAGGSYPTNPSMWCEADEGRDYRWVVLVHDPWLDFCTY